MSIVSPDFGLIQTALNKPLALGDIVNYITSMIIDRHGSMSP